ncbi:MAG TPA: TIGR03087 family PEP-CTERM/XrtA system glycosyltransferase [Plasticicumulans sp.]|nr:TIGR03087 family PEP-CTERM/XrtA system glycosyltransferase [Plasticicumulans sp.]
MEELLLLVHRIPYPPNKGDKIRSYHLLRFLTARYRVHLGAFVDDPADFAHATQLQAMCASLCLRPLDARRAKLRAFSGLLTGEALSLPYYRDRGFARWVDGVLARGVRRVVVFSSAMAQYVLDRPGLELVTDFCDVDSDKWRQYAQVQRWPQSWVYRREAARLLAFDRRVAAASRAALFVSEPEAALFRQLAPEAAGHTGFFHNGVDTAYFDPATTYENPYPAGGRPLVFTGAMDYRANVDAVDWYARAVLPIVRAAQPDAQFWIVGSRPAAAVQALGALPGVSVTGAVADVRPYVAHAAAAVAPLRIARGVQNKVLEAMAMARPVLATTAAMDGIVPNPRFDALVADEAAPLAAHTIRLLADGDRDGLGALGRAWVLAHYDWDTNLRPVAGWLEREAA